MTLDDGRNPLAVLHERLPDVTIDTIESSHGSFRVNAVYRNQRFEESGFLNQVFFSIFIKCSISFNLAPTECKKDSR